MADRHSLFPCTDAYKCLFASEMRDCTNAAACASAEAYVTNATNISELDAYWASFLATLQSVYLVQLHSSNFTGTGTLCGADLTARSRRGLKPARTASQSTAAGRTT